MREFLRGVEEIDARRVSAFVAVSTLFVAVVASLSREWVSFGTPVRPDCQQDLERVRFYSLFPYGTENPSRTLVVELYDNAFIENPILEINTEDPDKSFCPKLDLSFTDLPEIDAVAFQVTHPEERYATFNKDIIGISIDLQGNTITSYRAHRAP